MIGCAALHGRRHMDPREETTTFELKTVLERIESDLHMLIELMQDHLEITARIDRRAQG